jgi:hypothetical protein
MNTFEPKKRCILSYSEFLKQAEQAEKAKHDEKGEHDLVKKAMDGDKKGDKGIATLEESRQTDIDHAQSLLEDWADTEFVKGICKNEVPDYVLDQQRAGDGEGHEVWIEIKDIKPEAFKDLEADYEKFAKPFVEWAEKHDLYDPEILSTEDSLSFTITIG